MRKPVFFASWIWASDVCFIVASVVAAVMAFRSMEEVAIVMAQIGHEQKAIEGFLSPLPLSW